MIYKIKSKKEDLESYTAIDLALRHNQFQAVNTILSYIVKYQNHYVYSYIFENNFTDMIMAGVDLVDLLNSSIMYYKLDFDDKEWPQEDFSSEPLTIPFSKEIFRMRYNYHEIIG